MLPYDDQVQDFMHQILFPKIIQRNFNLQRQLISVESTVKYEPFLAGHSIF